MQDGHVVAYETHILHPIECHLQIYEKELLAVIHALSTWMHYLLDADFTTELDKEMSWLSMALSFTMVVDAKCVDFLSWMSMLIV